jgi:hypothetical protein
MDNESKSKWEVAFGRTLRMFALIVAAACMVMITGGLVLLLYHTGFEPWQAILLEHFAGTICVLGAAAISFTTVVFLRQSEGPIEFEACGMKFRGASGQFVLWAFGVIVLCLCGKMLW